MEEILHLIAKVEQKATTIIDLAKQEKEEIQATEQAIRNKFETDRLMEYREALTELQSKSEKEVQTKQLLLEEKTKRSSEQLKTYYDSNKESIIDNLVQQVTGA